ncbi:hypothetical protein C8Q75DRAFT_587073 [Abortiporus biennis]|nr:hypothetical protein C8Q75DRAFT_587073 [Abortiporus biennis]
MSQIDLIQAAWKGTDFLARNVSLWGERKDFKITTDIVGYKRDPEAGGRDVTKHDIPQDQPPVSAQVDNLADTLHVAENIPEEENGSVAEGAPEQEDIASRVDDALARGAVPVGSVVNDASQRNRKTTPKGKGQYDDKPKIPPYAAKMSHLDAEIFLEDKTDVAKAALHMDPKKPFLLDGEIHKTALGQIGEYAVEIMRRQHRKFVFSILTVANTIRFVRWDRCGIIATEPIDFVKDLTTFIKFFLPLRSYE